MLAMRSLALIVLACALASGFRVRRPSSRTEKAGRKAPPVGTADPAQAPASTPAVEYQLAAESSSLTGTLSQRLEGGTEVQFFNWFTNLLTNLLGRIGERFHGILDALLDLNVVSDIVDYVIDSTCDSGNDCPVTMAECVSPYSKSGRRPISQCSDITSREGTGLICAPFNRNVYGYKPCGLISSDRDIERACNRRCPSSLRWSDFIRLPEICGLYKDTLCPVLQSEDSAAWRDAAKELAKEALHPDAWIPVNRATGNRTFNGWMALVVKTAAGAGLALPGTKDPSIYRGMFPEQYRYKDCLAANNNMHEACKHHVEYDENPALKREAAYQLAVITRGYNYQNSCRGEEFNMAKFGAVGLGIEQSDMSNWCKQSDKRPNFVHVECSGIAGNVPPSRPKEPVGNLEQSSCEGVNWGEMAKVYDADLGVCVGKDAYSPVKVWKHHGLLSDTKVGLYMTEEGPNKVKLTLNVRGSELPDLSTLPEALTSEAFEDSALWRQLPATIKDWLFTDFNVFPRDDSICGNADVRVHNGFQNAYKTFKAYTRTQNPAGQSYLDEVAEVISAKMAAGKEVEFYISGHSLGAAMAALMAYDVYCHRSDSAHGNINSVLSFSKDRAANKATGPLLMTFGEAPVWYGKRSAAAFAAAVPASVHMRINTCGQETNVTGADTFYGGDIVGLAMDFSTDDDQGFRKRADGADFQCAWVSKTFFARASSTGLDSASMIENSTVIAPAAVDHATSSSCAGLLTVGGVSVFDSAIFCHFCDRYMEGLVNDRGVENNFAARNLSGVARRSMFHEYNRPKAETRATCQDLGTYSYDGESYVDVPQVLAEYELRNVVTDLLNIPVGEIYDRLAARTGMTQRISGEIQAKGEGLKAIAEGLFGV